ncbi:oxidoreductase [Methylobacterium nonmethylotrophicum]|uniref:SDR family NAD(P)-dependent oxidoreductase n=1 Tax=Methylobacterium nonmethylotrophicum TaxID=1141884 RepID=A0A4Z0NQS8_9HYPH|nr:oxidoreductase [Methylobacterium nonmethylotrophicum]TGD98685.1 SDR family NAD(P)-dependent oxidoreductase [Methylobacterium nonmethylotrophicum]
MHKVALVTGASSGIGAATVQRLMQDGFTVYAAARRVGRMDGLRRAGARLLELDLTDDASIVAAVAAIEEAGQGLSVLVNNAGYGSYGALEDVPLAEARRQFEVNLFGAARLIQLTLPMMRAARAGTIVNVTSVGGKVHEPFGAWYHATKFALEGLSDCLRMEVAPFGVRVVVIEPGAIKTEWGGIAHESLVERSGASDYAPWARRHAGMLARADQASFGSPPEVVAGAIARAVAARRPRTRYAVGGGASVILAVRRVLSDRAFDRLMWAGSQAERNERSLPAKAARDPVSPA